MQTAQIMAIRFVGRGSGTCWKAFDVQLRKCPRDVGKQRWPSGRGRRAEKLDHWNQLTVSLLERRIEPVRPVDQKGRGDDQVDGDDRGGHQRRNLSADTPEIEKTCQLHDQPLAGVVTASTVGVNK